MKQLGGILLLIYCSAARTGTGHFRQESHILCPVISVQYTLTISLYFTFDEYFTFSAKRVKIALTVGARE